ncbi:hypothetical protein M405DRAFT_846035 [Rhizopogon salebrosus TDB-379]|nr:hypothetical protein M405DRAFT_846035 [Rhizopogon salebrosus TDB-379]
MIPSPTKGWNGSSACLTKPATSPHALHRHQGRSRGAGSHLTSVLGSLLYGYNLKYLEISKGEYDEDLDDADWREYEEHRNRQREEEAKQKELELRCKEEDAKRKQERWYWVAWGYYLPEHSRPTPLLKSTIQRPERS